MKDLFGELYLADERDKHEVKRRWYELNEAEANIARLSIVVPNRQNVETAESFNQVASQESPEQQPISSVPANVIDISSRQNQIDQAMEAVNFAHEEVA